jgi:hypothetical protein
MNFKRIVQRKVHVYERSPLEHPKPSNIYVIFIKVLFCSRLALSDASSYVISFVKYPFQWIVAFKFELHDNVNR